MSPPTQGIPLAADGERLARLAERFGTPLFVYDAQGVRARFAELQAFDRVRYAQKANGNLALLSLLRGLGAHVDAVSAGEILRALAAGFEPDRIVYTADLFEPESLELVREHGLVANLGSADMLEPYARVRPRAEVWLRVNPGFGHGHDRRVATGGATSKHGIWHGELPAAIARAEALGLSVAGLHVHTGSGSDLEHLARGAQALRSAAPLAAGTLAVLSAGGGLPVPYRPDEEPLDVGAYARHWLALRDELARALGRPLALETEPGRFLVAEAGLLLTRVVGRKRTPGHDWVLVDTGFHHLVRPALYGAWHAVRAVLPRPGPLAPRLVAGPLCESGDVLTLDGQDRLDPRPLPELMPGDLLAIENAGAYGLSMASTYNSRPLPAEVLVDGDRERVVRRRQGTLELLAAELEAQAEVEDWD